MKRINILFIFIFRDLDRSIFLIQGDKEGSHSAAIQLFTVGISIKIEDADLS